MSISKKQKLILDFAISKDGPFHKMEVVEEFGHWYYHNSAKYIGLILARMIDNHILERKKKGVYQIRQTVLTNYQQLQLF